MNAFTWEDLTNYYVSLPANRLELWGFLESDRIANPVFREFYSERDVVFEERRMRTDSTPLGKFSEQLLHQFESVLQFGTPDLQEQNVLAIGKITRSPR